MMNILYIWGGVIITLGMVCVTGLVVYLIKLMLDDLSVGSTYPEMVRKAAKNNPKKNKILSETAQNEAF